MKEQRLKSIAEIVGQQGLVTTKDLQKRFNVSKVTLRKDLLELEARGLLERVHGGAKSLNTPSGEELDLLYSVRTTINTDEKQRIAQYAYTLISPEDVIALDASSTVRELAMIIAKSPVVPKAVFTNDVEIAKILADSMRVDLTVIGGHVRKGHYSAVGMFATNMWKQLRADKLFLGVDAIRPDIGFFNYSSEEVESKRLMIDCTAQRYIICDHTKFFTHSIVQISALSSADLVITGKELNDEAVNEYGEFRHKIIRV